MKKLLFTLFITLFFSVLFLFQQLLKFLGQGLLHVPGLRRYALRMDI